MSAMELPLLSVIIPMYNAEKYIEKCVRSILNQTYKKLEIILVNDGSTDQSGMVVERIAAKSKKVTIIHQENKGVSVARNVGIKNSSGDYFTFIDADDYLNQETYSIIINELVQNKCDAALYPFSRDYKDSVTVDMLPWPNKTILHQKEIRGVLIPAMIAIKKNECAISGSVSRTVFRRSTKENLFFDESVHIQEDLIFCIQAYAHLHTIEIINEVVYHYVKHGESTTEHYRKNFLSESVAFEKAIVLALQECKLYEKLSKRYWAKRVTMYSLCLSNLFRFDAPKEIDTELRNIIACFEKDNYIRNRFCSAYLERRMLVPYLLLQIKNKTLIKLIYGCKERYRQRKLSS